jgi:meiotically up-regulated gene 157 (Mug157) protein
MKPGVHEHKWEVDSLCYPIRLAHGYWKQTGDTTPFDSEWEEAMGQIAQTFREQQRKTGHGPYYFQRGGSAPDMNDPGTYGKPVKPIGLIYSAFRPSDDETVYPFLIPSNFFAAVSLRQMAEMLGEIRHNPRKAKEAEDLAQEVEQALKQYAAVSHPGHGAIYAYEIDGLGGTLLMDDANVPSLLSLPYLGAKKSRDPLYQATRRFVWSADNPWFFQGKYAGIGGPHVGQDMIWPISLIMYGLTSRSTGEVRSCLQTLKATHGGTGFMHESFNKDDPGRYSRSWFAWANTLFGEFVLDTAHRFPEALA